MPDLTDFNTHRSRAIACAETLKELKTKLHIGRTELSEATGAPLNTVSSWTRPTDNAAKPPPLVSLMYWDKLCAFLESRKQGSGIALAKAAGRTWLPQTKGINEETTLTYTEDAEKAQGPATSLDRPSSALLAEPLHMRADDANQRLDPIELPLPHGQLVGRFAEVETLCKLFLSSGSQLVTLVGPAGVGKTELEIEVANNLIDTYNGQIVYIPLTLVSDPKRLTQAIAAALKVKVQAGESLFKVVRTILRSRRLLLVLDNFEQIRDGAGDLLGKLISGARGLRVLVTSRVRLGIPGERIHEVKPLQLPEPQAHYNVQELIKYSAIELFVREIQRRLPNYQLQNDTSQAIVAICRRLDGLPMALQLAAVYIGEYPEVELRKRLDKALQRKAILTDNHSNNPGHRRTIESTIEWSYSLLSDREKVLFQWLSVFAGSFTAEDVTGLINPTRNSSNQETSSPISELDIIPLLQNLTAKSLLKGDTFSGGRRRYTMLRLIYDFARELAEKENEVEDLQRRHAQWFIEQTRRVRSETPNASELSWESQTILAAYVAEEYDNLRAALKWALRQPDPGLASELAIALSAFWSLRDHSQEGSAQLASMLDRTALAPESQTMEEPQNMPSLSPELRSMFMEALSVLLQREADYERARYWTNEELAIRRMLDDKSGESRALMQLGRIEMAHRNYDKASGFYRQSMQIAQKLGDEYILARLYSNMGVVAAETGSYEKALNLYLESLRVWEELGDEYRIARVQCDMSMMYLALENTEQAMYYVKNSLQLRRKLRDTSGIAASLHNLGEVQVELGEDVKALANHLEALQIQYTLGERSSFAPSLEAQARIVANLQRAELAAHFFGSAERLRQIFKQPRSPHEDLRIDAYMLEVQQHLGRTRWENAYKAGKQFEGTKVVDYALEEGQLILETLQVSPSSPI